MERLFYYSRRSEKCQGAMVAGLELVGEVIEAGLELGNALGEAVAFGAGGEGLLPLDQTLCLSQLDTFVLFSHFLLLDLALQQSAQFAEPGMWHTCGNARTLQ